MGQRGTWGRSAGRLLPLGLLLVGIAVHGVRIETTGEDPQSGSAFAMFATIDVTATRRVLVAGPDLRPLELPDALTEQAARLADAPSVAGAQRLADALRAHTRDEVHVTVVGLDADGWTMTRRTLAAATAR